MDNNSYALQVTHDIAQTRMFPNLGAYCRATTAYEYNSALLRTLEPNNEVLRV